MANDCPGLPLTSAQVLFLLEYEAKILWGAWADQTKKDYLDHARHYQNFIHTFNVYLKRLQDKKVVPRSQEPLAIWPVTPKGWRIYAVHMITYRPGRSKAKALKAKARPGLKYSTYVTYKSGVIWYQTMVLGKPWFGNIEPEKRTLRIFHRSLKIFAETELDQTAPMRAKWLNAMATSAKSLEELQVITMACFADDHFLRSNEFLPLIKERPLLLWCDVTTGTKGTIRLAVHEAKAHKGAPVQFSYQHPTGESRNSNMLLARYKRLLTKLDPKLVAPGALIFPNLSTKRRTSPLSQKTFWKRLTSLAARAGIPSHDWNECTANSFRSGAMTRMMRNGCPIHILQRLGRWKSLAALLYYRPSGEDQCRQKSRWNRPNLLPELSRTVPAAAVAPLPANSGISDISDTDYW
ncbi:MAG: tyrosine-type recombinase/integrase [Limisphaerales bacterium]